MMKLEIGYNKLFEIRKETIVHKGAINFSVLFLSDLHFNGYSGGILKNIIEAIEEQNPDIILLGGDYADSRKGLVFFELLMDAIAERKNVFAIAGNHDYLMGIDHIKNIVISHKSTWLEKDNHSFFINGMKIRIDGNLIRKDIDEESYRILVLHKPAFVPEGFYHLAMAGHLHGGQVVLWQNEKGLFPGKFFYKWNILKWSIENYHFFVSKGLGDTLPVRYNCKKDMIMVYVNSEKPHNK